MEPNPPEWMRKLPIWLLRKGKIPYYLNGQIRSGTMGTPEDLAGMGTYHEASRALHGLQGGKGFDGLGIALGRVDEEIYLQCIDFDDVDANNNGPLVIEAREYGYAEVSQSNKGAHVYGLGPRFPRQKKTSGIEAYCEGQFIAFTGVTISEANPIDLSPLIERIAKERIPVTEPNSLVATLPPLDDGKMADLREALNAIDSNDYPTWFRILAALKSAGENTKELAREWSAKSPKHTDAQFDKKWSNLTIDPTRTDYRVVFAEAMRSGWHNSGYEQDVPMVEISLPNPFLKSSAPPKQYAVIKGQDLKNRPDIEWRIRGIFPARGLGCVYGPSASGKSFLVLDMACAICMGVPWFGYKVNATTVFCIGLEGDAGYKGRVLAWEIEHDSPIPSNLGFILQQRFSLLEKGDIEKLAATIPQHSVVIIDTLNQAALGIDENSSKDMGRVIENASLLMRLINGLVILVSHTGKNTELGLRGHSSVFAALDGAIAILREGKSKTRQWKVDKAKDGQDGESHSFSLKVLETGRDGEGETLTSCVIVKEKSSNSVAHSMLTETQQLAMSAFFKALKAHGNSRLGEVNKKDWQPIFCAEYKPELKIDSKRRAFDRAVDDLVKLGRLRPNGELYRLPIASSEVFGQITETGQDPDMSTSGNGQTGQQPLGLSKCPSVEEGKYE